MKYSIVILFILTVKSLFSQPRPTRADTLFMKAGAYAMSKKIDNAFQSLDSATKIGFSKHKLLETDARFEYLRKDPRYKTLHDRVLDNAYPCRTLAEAKAFDFWLGDWDVYSTASPTFKTGFNRITRAAQGCIILENWKAVGPHEGMSINYFDPRDKKWKQKWAGSGQDVQDFYDGEYVGDAMRFKFIGTNSDGTSFNGRLTFTNMAPGKVRQHSERTDDNGKTWQTIYDFIYIRRVDGAKP